MAELVIDISKLRHNIHYVRNYCEAKQLELVVVLKGAFSVSAVIQEFLLAGVHTFGISDLMMAKKCSQYQMNTPVFIKLPSIREAPAVVQYCGASVNSELRVVQALARAAREKATSHGIILMVDLGDQREGVMPEETLSTVEAILDAGKENLDFLGIGTNLGCCAGALPEDSMIRVLDELALEIERRFGAGPRVVSVGGSVMLDWMQHHELPRRVNQIRLGEVMLLGNIPGVNEKHANLHDDVFIFRTDVLEVKDKLIQKPVCQGKDALGYDPKITCSGIRKRALLNFGISNTDPSGLETELANCEIVAYNSNYTIVDCSDCDTDLKPGDVLEFKMNYRSLLQSCISPFVTVTFIGHTDQEYSKSYSN